MNPELLVLGAAAGAALGEVIDYGSARLATRKETTAPVPDWQPDEMDEAAPVPETPEEIQDKEFWAKRAGKFTLRHVSFIAIDGAAFGMSLVALASPPTATHTVERANIGITFDASGQTANTYGSGFAITTEQTYYEKLVGDSRLKTSSELSWQNTSTPASESEIESASPLGGSDLDDGIKASLVRDKAVVVITAGSEVDDLQNDINQANADAEHVFVVDVESSTDPDLKQLADATGGQYFLAGSYSPSNVNNSLRNIELPVESEKSLVISNDDPALIAIASATGLGLVVAALRRTQHIIQWRFKRRSK